MGQLKFNELSLKFCIKNDAHVKMVSQPILLSIFFVIFFDIAIKVICFIFLYNSRSIKWFPKILYLLYSSSSSSADLYYSWRVFAAITIYLHSSLLWTIVIHSRTPIFFRSSSNVYNHFFLGRPRGLFPVFIILLEFNYCNNLYLFQ